MPKDELDCKQDIPFRKSCNFAVRIDPEGDTYVLRHIPGRSEHNHAPNVHPEVFSENAPFEKRTDETEVPDFKTLLSSPYVRIRLLADVNNLFFAHTDGCRLWKTYPEVILVEEVSPGVVLFRGIDCHAATFPVAACLIEKTPNWNWMFTQLKELFDDYQIAHPGFFQIDIDETCVKQCYRVFRNAHQYLDKKAGALFAQNEVRKFMTNGWEALSLWDEIVQAENEIEQDRLMDKMYSCYRGGTKQFLKHMEKKLYMVSVGEKNMSLHFGVRECARYKRSWGIEGVSDVEQKVVRLLKTFVEIYEVRSRTNGQQLVSTRPEYTVFYKDVLHIVSDSVLTVARNFLEAKGNTGCWCPNDEALGYPCVHDLGQIRKERNLAPDDFHPHWRNMYVDVSAVSISGKGGYAKEWEKLKSEEQKYVPEFTEEERPAKRQCL